jgi:trimeric autotransporter adhesin
MRNHSYRFLEAVLICAALADVASGQELRAGTVVTIAGDSTSGYNGDTDGDGRPRPSIGAELNLPWGVAVGPDGLDVYVSDAGNHRVRRIDTRHWDIFTVAGNGSADFRGDGELAVNASISGPAGLAVDRDGNIYIADRGNHRVRMVGPDGIITTVAGGSQPGFSGDMGIATQATLKSPVDVVIDTDGSLYISDAGNNRIRKVDAKGLITTIAGSGNRKFDGDEQPALRAGLSPSGIALDGAGGLLIADTRNHRIRLVDLQTGIITTHAGVGRRGFSGDGDLAQGARLSTPWGVAVSAVGDIYVTDSGNNRIRRIQMATGLIETIAGKGGASFSGDGEAGGEANFWTPYGIAIDLESNILVADYLNHRLRRINMHKSQMPVHVPRLQGGIPRWAKGAFIVLTSALGYFVYDAVQPPPDLPAPPEFPQ